MDNITDNNKLIAEFMGSNFEMIGDEEACTLRSGTRYMTKHLKYHSSWDWLMPVVEKIYDKEGLDISGLFTEFLNIAPVDIYNIKYVYCSVIEFIKWYNANNKGE